MQTISGILFWFTLFIVYFVRIMVFAKKDLEGREKLGIGRENTVEGKKFTYFHLMHVHIYL